MNDAHALALLRLLAEDGEVSPRARPSGWTSAPAN